MPNEPRTIRPEHIRGARGWLNWTIADLAKATGLHENTIANAELGRSLLPETAARIQVVLEAQGLRFYWPGDVVEEAPVLIIRKEALQRESRPRRRKPKPKPT